MPRVLVIIPAFNEQDSVAGVVSELARELPDYDLVVIDDGSTDATAERVPPNAHLIRLPFNVGIGGAMQTGYRYAALHDYDIAIQVDGVGENTVANVARDTDTEMSLIYRRIDRMRNKIRKSKRMQELMEHVW